MANFTNAELYEIGKRQKAIIWLVLFGILAIFIPIVGPIVMAVLNVVFVYRLACALKSRVAWLWCILTILPLISLIGLLIINGIATNTLRKSGIKIGLMGADKDQMDKL